MTQDFVDAYSYVDVLDNPGALNLTKEIGHIIADQRIQQAQTTRNQAHYNQ